LRWSILFLPLLMVACGGNPAGSADTLTAVSKVNTGLGAQGTAVAALDPSQLFAQKAREEAAKTLGIAPEQLNIDKIESVRWSDSSLGCAAPGKAYAQVLTPGIRVALSGAGQKIEVHGDTSGRLVVCKNPTQ
jgi:hypothetical protein